MLRLYRERKRHFAYLKYVLRHKYHVFRAGMLLGVPIWQLVIHDLSKFSKVEWFAYAETFYEENGLPRYKESYEFSAAWNHHQKVNPHHWQYYQLVWDRGTKTILPIPINYLLEMLADWSGAGKVIADTYSPIAWVSANDEILKANLEEHTYYVVMALMRMTDWSSL